MNRAFLSVLLFDLGLSLAGCAASVDDPVPPPPPQEQQRDPPAIVLGTKLRDPHALLLLGAEIDNGIERVRNHEQPPKPGPLPEKN